MTGKSLWTGRMPKYGLFLACIILFVIFVRIRLLDIPLERDEGEYTYMGQLLLQGVPPYGEAYNMKFPGTYIMYALSMAVLGSEPEIFFYADRRSATGYIYMYSLMENHEYALRMQKDMIVEIEAQRPKFLIDVRPGLSWLQMEDSEPYVFQWMADYISRNYDLVGVADMLYPGLTIYKWYDEAKNYRIQSDASLVIYERRQVYSVSCQSILT